MQSTTQNGLPNSANYFYLNNGNTDLVLGTQRHQRDLFSGSHLGIPDVTTHVGSVVHAFETLARSRANRSFSNLVEHGEQPYELSAGSITNSNKSLLRCSSQQNLHNNNQKNSNINNMSFVNNTISSNNSSCTMIKKKKNSIGDSHHKIALVDVPMNYQHHYNQQHTLPHNQQQQSFHPVPLVYHSQRIVKDKESPSRHRKLLSSSSSTKSTNIPTLKQKQQPKQRQQLPAIPSATTAAHHHRQQQQQQPLQTFRGGQNKGYVPYLVKNNNNNDDDGVEIFYHSNRNNNKMKNDLNSNFNSINIDDDYRKNLFGIYPNRDSKIFHSPQQLLMPHNIQTTITMPTTTTTTTTITGTKQTITTNGNYKEKDIHFCGDLLNSTNTTTTTTTTTSSTHPIRNSMPTNSKIIIRNDYADNGDSNIGKTVVIGDIHTKQPILVPNYFLSSSRTFFNNNITIPSHSFPTNTITTAITRTTNATNNFPINKSLVKPQTTNNVKQTTMKCNTLTHDNYFLGAPQKQEKYKHCTQSSSTARLQQFKDNNNKHNNVRDNSNYKFSDNRYDARNGIGYGAGGGDGGVDEDNNDNFLRGSTVSQSFIKNVKLNNSNRRMTEFNNIPNSSGSSKTNSNNNKNSTQHNVHQLSTTSSTGTSNGFRRDRMFSNSMGAGGGGGSLAASSSGGFRNSTSRKILQHRRHKSDNVIKMRNDDDDELKQRFIEHHDERFDVKNSMHKKLFKPNLVDRAVI